MYRYLVVHACTHISYPLFFTPGYGIWRFKVYKNARNEELLSGCRYTDDMELDDAVHTAILTLKEG